MTIYLGADHRGFGLKEHVKAQLTEAGYDVRDIGAAQIDVADDYPDFAIIALEALSQDLKNRAILICGSGHGMDMIANKFSGVRAALCFNTAVAKQSREHEDANVLVLASDWVKEQEAWNIIEIWLETEYGKAERNERRLRKIKEIEEKHFKE
ncbi:MAG: RpiB/LacA/LacB family sugar-phosphate isomerase [Candidatus Sungbacteria bacterium]|uniref:RpiB/LacA/LacB family sugar-phosphate isomerase n=1 Tax=Candidatus Sungiibacteriota bacterium TaxID=2750080 RepID=A0A9D6QYB4_9BACT|nr:RpiB/LacA/LacB family sugar-phosphate isomerase [Candidatus Sungbacteria bacterium]